MYKEPYAVPAHLHNSGSGGAGAGDAGDRTSFSFANEDFDNGFGASTLLPIPCVRDLTIPHLSGVHSLTNKMSVCVCVI